MKISQTILLLLAVIFATSCHRQAKENTATSVEQYETEKKAILATIQNETKAAFQRDYEGWKAKWVHHPNISKTYMNFVENSHSESIGWNKINAYVKIYIEEHPNPDPTPTLVEEIDVRLYGNGAWVTFEQNDPKRGLKRESRLMEKINGKWKIAGMHTSIYGFEKEE